MEIFILFRKFIDKHVCCLLMFIYIVYVFVDSLYPYTTILLFKWTNIDNNIYKSFDILVHLYFYSNKFMYSHVFMKDLKLYNVYNIFEF